MTGMGIGSGCCTGEAAARAAGSSPRADELRFCAPVGTFREAEKTKKLFEAFWLPTHPQLISYAHQHGCARAGAGLPEGITLRTFNPETDAEAVYRSDNDAFRDHFAY